MVGTTEPFDTRLDGRLVVGGILTDDKGAHIRRMEPRRTLSMNTRLVLAVASMLLGLIIDAASAVVSAHTAVRRPAAIIPSLMPS
jgi:hypothetical protein